MAAYKKPILGAKGKCATFKNRFSIPYNSIQTVTDTEKNM